MAMNLVLAIGIMIIAGFFAGRLAHKLKFPMISGYIVVGILLSPSVLNIISRTSIKDLDIITSIALGIIAYSIGSWSYYRFRATRPECVSYFRRLNLQRYPCLSYH